MAPYGDPLRAIFLETGVDTKAAEQAVDRLDRAANRLTESLLGVARAAKLAGSGSSSGVIRANTAMGQSYKAMGASARGAAMDLFYLQRAQFEVGRNMQIASGGAGSAPMNRGALMNPMLPYMQGPGGFTVVPGGSPNFRTFAQSYASRNASPWNPNTFMRGVNVPSGGPRMASMAAAGPRGRGSGNYGLGTSIYLTTLGLQAGGYAYGQSANLQRSSTLAGFASGQSPAAMRAQSLALRGEYNMRLRNSTALTQEIAQLGVKDPESQTALARAGAGFNVLEQTVSAGDAAAAIYRLIRATSRSEDEFEKGTQAAVRYAGAIYAAGNQSAAGAAAVFAMVQEIEPLAQFMRLGANGTIALSAAFADLNENQRELFRGALTRMAIEGKIDPNNPVQSLITMAQRLREAGSEAEKINLLKSMGFDNIRDVQTLAVMASSLEVFGEALGVVNEELTGTSKFGSQINTVLADQKGSWDALTSSMDAMAASVMNNVAPVLMTLMALLTGVADAVAANPLLGWGVGIGAAALAGRAGMSGIRRFMGGDRAARLAGLGFNTPHGSVRHGRLAGRLSGAFPMLGADAALRMTSTRFGVRMAEGVGLGAGRGLGRMNGLSLGLMKYLPMGEKLAVGAAGRMAAGGVVGGAMRLATGPVGWIVTALMVGAPLFERLGNAMSNLAQKAGFLGPVIGVLGLVFDVLAAGGRILNKAFDWLAKGGKWLLDFVTGGNADEILGGMNRGIGNLHEGISGIAKDPSKAGTDQPPKAPGSSTVNIYTGGSQSGYQQAMDEVGRRAARTMPSNTYGGIVV